MARNRLSFVKKLSIECCALQCCRSNLRGNRRLALGGIVPLFPTASDGPITCASASNALSAISVSVGMCGNK